MILTPNPVISIIAGSDTTSTALAATLFYLVRNPVALDRVAAEVCAAFADVEAIENGAALTGCAYLRACIDEAMRMSPSVGGLLPRETLAGGATVDGEHIPAGIVVGVPQYAIHHNAVYYPEPHRFKPERWIAGSAAKSSSSAVVGEEDVARAQAAFCPFSIGPRGCIGKGLAYAEMMTALARVLYIYDIRRAVGVPDPGEGSSNLGWGRHREDEYQLVDTFTSMKNGPMVEFRARI